MTRADELLGMVYARLGIESASAGEKYSCIEEIVDELMKENRRRTIAVATTGAISERLCRLALDDCVGPDHYERLGDRAWKWLADFAVLGRPLNVLISVKSFKAKERLLASGSGSALAPTIGWGLFDDPAEWHKDRLTSYLLRGFTSIYMPEALVQRLDASAARKKNSNGRPFLRDLKRFGTDLLRATVRGRIEPRLL